MLIKSLLEGNYQDDNHYITVQILSENEEGIEINVDTTQEAVTHTREVNGKNIYDIRVGRENCWLISGGILIFNEKRELALGLRDGNSVEGFSFTNIASGRCDRDLIEHCFEELESELLVFGKRGARWEFLKIGEQSLQTVKCNQDDVKREFDKCVAKCSDEGFLTEYLQKEPHKKNIGKIRYFLDGQFQYEFNCFLFVDKENKTIEYRLFQHYDFSEFEEVKIFFNEGTGYGCFKSLEAIKGLIEVERVWGSSLVVPLVKEVVKQYR